MRLFIAAEISAEARNMLNSAHRRIPPEVASVKWVEEENLHVTLKFLGDVSDERLPKIMEALSHVRFSEFASRVSGIGVFPNEDAVRVIWAGAEPKEEFFRLQKAIDDALAPMGFSPERDFTPHVTIGRVHMVADSSAFSEKLSLLKNLGESEYFRVDKFILKKSTLTPKGPVYMDVASFSTNS